MIEKREPRAVRATRLQLTRKGPKPEAPAKSALNLSRPAKLKNNNRRKPEVFGGLKKLGPTFKHLLKLGGLSLAVAASLAIVSAILVGGYFYLIRADYFAIRKISISGLEKVAKEDVLAAAGLNAPNNILDVRLSKMERALNEIPWIASAKISRVLPDAIDIKVTEFRAKSLVNIGSLYYLDDSGRPFKKVEAGENPGLPIISGFSQDDLLEQHETVQEGLKEVFALMDVLEIRNDAFRLENISEIHFDAVRGLTIFTRDDGLQIKVGFGQYDDKFIRLGQVLAHMKTNGQYVGLVYLNLECAPRVVARHKQPAV